MRLPLIQTRRRFPRHKVLLIVMDARVRHYRSISNHADSGGFCRAVKYCQAHAKARSGRSQPSLFLDGEFPTQLPRASSSPSISSFSTRVALHPSSSLSSQSYDQQPSVFCPRLFRTELILLSSYPHIHIPIASLFASSRSDCTRRRGLLFLLFFLSLRTYQLIALALSPLSHCKCAANTTSLEQSQQS